MPSMVIGLMKTKSGVLIESPDVQFTHRKCSYIVSLTQLVYSFLINGAQHSQTNSG